MKHKSTNLGSKTRRNFLNQSLLAAGATVFGFPAIVSSRSPNNRLKTVVIACGGRGAANLKEIGALTDVAALCDVNAQALEQGLKSHPGARTYKDFRELYAKETDYDAAVISTAEHTHAFAVLPALRAGKHVYCEKPLTRDVHEARVVMEAAQKAGVTTQMGTQLHASENYRRVVELVQSGAIGPVREVHVWVSRAWGMQSAAEAEAHGDLFVKAGLLEYIDKMPTEAQPVPPQLDWDLWTGPAPMRPYHDIYFPGPRWYRYWDFANGTMSDLGSHWNDLPFWALKLEHPQFVSAAGPPPHAEIAPASMTATYEYGARGDLPPVKLTWYQGAMKPPILEEKKIAGWSNGVLFIGDGGMLLSDYGKHVLLPEEKFQTFTAPPQTLAPSVGHHKEFVECAMAGKPALCDFSYSGLLTIANHLGGVAYRSGTRFAWDPVKGTTSEAAANKYLSREYRDGWKL
jgi:hypothetical protein